MEVEICIIGAGIVGIALARELSLAGREVVVVEKNRQFGMETSSHNSEVIHSGIYYNPDSLKLRTQDKIVYALGAQNEHFENF